MDAGSMIQGICEIIATLLFGAVTGIFIGLLCLFAMAGAFG